MTFGIIKGLYAKINSYRKNPYMLPNNFGENLWWKILPIKINEYPK